MSGLEKKPGRASHRTVSGEASWGSDSAPTPLTQCVKCKSRSIPEIREATDALVRTIVESGAAIKTLAPQTPRWARMALLTGAEVVRRYDCSNCGHVRAVLSFDRVDRERFRRAEHEHDIKIERSAGDLSRAR